MVGKYLQTALIQLDKGTQQAQMRVKWCLLFCGFCLVLCLCLHLTNCHKRLRGGVGSGPSVMQPGQQWHDLPSSGYDEHLVRTPKQSINPLRIRALKIIAHVGEVS